MQQTHFTTLAKAMAMAMAVALAMPALGEDRQSVPDENWILVHIDTETTGLVAGYHELIDIGIVYTDLDGKVLRSFYRKIQPDHPERLDPVAKSINGYDFEYWAKQGAIRDEQALADWMAFDEQHFPGKKMLRVAQNSPFDTSFVNALLRKHRRKLPDRYSYFFLDLPSIAWGLGFRELFGPKLAARLGVPDEPHTALEHTGLSGAEVNVRIYQKLVEYRRRISAPSH